MDFGAMERLAKARPQWRIILVGPIKDEHDWPVNVELPGQVSHENLKGWIEAADVLLLPYVINAYTEAVLPAKTYECLATGRPVVAAPLPELEAGFDDVMTFVKGESDWAKMVEAVVAGDTEDLRQKRRMRGEKNSWVQRYAELKALLVEMDESHG